MMVDIQFETENEFARQVESESRSRGMAALVIKWGFAKNEKAAQRVLIGVAIGVVLLAFIMPVLIGSSSGGVVGRQTPASERTIPGPNGIPTGQIAP